MTAPAPSFPSSRELAGLWRSLNHADSADCWICHLLLHRVEAPVLVQAPSARLPLELAALRALAACEPATAVDLERRLALGPALVRRVLGKLAEDSLVQSEGPERWRVSATGSRLAAGQGVAAQAFERAVFYFHHRPDGAVSYLHLRQPGTPLTATPPGWSFAPRQLVECVQRPAEWKSRHHFPDAITEVLTLQSDLGTLTPDLPAWQLVVLDRAEHLTLLVIVQDGSLHGYAVEPQSWKVSSTEPALVLNDRSAVTETFGDLLREPEAESWHAVWKEWCADHGIPLAEAAGIRLVRRGVVLQVTGHPLRPERLRSLVDPTQPEHWLLAGAGPCRCAARIEFAAPRGRR